MALNHLREQDHPGSDEGRFVMLPMTASQTAMPEVFELPLCNKLRLDEISVDELQHHYLSGALSAAEYVKFCLERIQKVQHSTCL